MKDKAIGILVAVWTLCLLAGAARSFVDFARPPIGEVRPLLSTPIGELKGETVICPAAGNPAIRYPAKRSERISASLIVNTSATCVQVGGSDVTSTTGGAVGLGCALGQSFAFDGSQAFCVSSGAGAVSVQVLFGAS